MITDINHMIVKKYLLNVYDENVSFLFSNHGLITVDLSSFVS